MNHYIKKYLEFYKKKNWKIILAVFFFFYIKMFFNMISYM